MSCSPFDLRDYSLKELTGAERQQTENHLQGCPECREELERLRLTEAALLSLGEEEIPQRIGFVSDKVFEPSGLQRWWQAFWGSAARLGFASAAMLSVAILVAALSRPAPAPQPAAGSLSRVEAARLEADFTARIQQAVAQAVADAEVRQQKKMEEVLASEEKRHVADHQMMVTAAENVDYLDKHFNLARFDASQAGGANR